MLPIALIQYIFKGAEHEVINARPHGNSKRTTPYRRILPSIRDRMKQSIYTKEKPKKVLEKIFISAGDFTHARRSSELPRASKDVYNARYSEKKVKNRARECSTESNTLEADAIWTVLEKAKRQRTELDGFIRECSLHPDLFIVLASDRQLEELEQFCTDPNDFTVLGIDPTLNIFNENISLTVTTYRNLRLIKKDTGKAPVFIGPILMHQKKDWKTYSKFAHQLIAEKPSLEGILACGTNGERAIVDGFTRCFRFATFLCCTMHMKDNITRELTARGLNAQDKKEILDEIFGKQDGKVEFNGLIDCSSGDEFDEKVLGLKKIWDKREQASNNGVLKKCTFHEWFIKEKVINITFDDNSSLDINIKKLAKNCRISKPSLGDKICLSETKTC